MRDWIEEKQLQAYNSAHRRGYISDNLKADTIDKLMEEVEELSCSELRGKFDPNSEESEIADIIITLLTYTYAMDIDLITAIERKMEYNEDRD